MTNFPAAGGSFPTRTVGPWRASVSSIRSDLHCAQFAFDERGREWHKLARQRIVRWQSSGARVTGSVGSYWIPKDAVVSDQQPNSSSSFLGLFRLSSSGGASSNSRSSKMSFVVGCSSAGSPSTAIQAVYPSALKMRGFSGHPGWLIAGLRQRNECTAKCTPRFEVLVRVDR